MSDEPLLEGNDPFDIEKNLAELKAENESKPLAAGYSRAVHEAAMALWISGWEEVPICQALGIRRRNTLSDWAKQEGWAEKKAAFQKRVGEKMIELGADKKAELNAKYLEAVDGVLGRLYEELANNQELHSRSVEAASQAVFQGIKLKREIQGFAEEITVNTRQSHEDKYAALLQRYKDDPAKLARVIAIERQRIDLDAQLEDLDE